MCIYIFQPLHPTNDLSFFQGKSVLLRVLGLCFETQPQLLTIHHFGGQVFEAHNI